MARTAFTGVNLGGWLILEKWLTPSAFAGLDADDEWALSQTATGRERIRRHRKSFITEQDFRWLHDHGISVVRLPVPYWAVVDTDEYVSAKKELAWAMNMAEKYDIKVLIDVHAVRGGQNTGDHSGKKGQAEWFDSEQFQTETLDILKKLATNYKDNLALWGIELLNEPDAAGHYWQLLKFYRKAFRELQSILPKHIKIVFHDGFRPIVFAGALWTPVSGRVVIDVHWYGFTLPTKKYQRWVRQSRWVRRMLLVYLRMWHPVIVGEWSSVLPQRFFDERPQREHMDLLKQNIAMQERVHRKALGSMYWNYKAEGEGMWNFRWLVEHGIIDVSGREKSRDNLELQG